MDPEEISRQAKKERNKEKKTSSKKTTKKKTKARSHSWDSFYVYQKIYPSKFNLILWIFFVGSIGAVFIFLWLLSDDFGLWSLYLGIGLIALFMLRILVDFFTKVFTFNTYKNFQKNLPFGLVGWDKLGSKRNFLKPQFWAIDSTVEVVLLDGVLNADIKRINDAIVLFTANANKCFYEGRFGSDGRKKWTLNNILMTTGSADIAVAGEMYRLIRVYLKSIHGKYPVVKEVRVIFGNEVYEVEPPLSGDIG